MGSKLAEGSVLMQVGSCLLCFESHGPIALP